MAHQMKNLCVFSVFHCVEGAFGAASGGTPKMKNGAPRDELRNGRGRGWAVAYDSFSTPLWTFWAPSPRGPGNSVSDSYVAPIGAFFCTSVSPINCH